MEVEEDWANKLDRPITSIIATLSSRCKVPLIGVGIGGGGGALGDQEGRLGRGGQGGSQ